MIPSRIVRYFIFLGYALGRGGLTRFSTFKNGIVHFYFAYLRHGYYLKKPLHYPATYGLN